MSTGKRRLIVKEDFNIGYGATTIPADSGGTRDATKVGLHTWNEVINVKQYGALGDGVTVDTTAVQTAIDEAWDSGACVYFPAGEYVLGNITLPTGDTGSKTKTLSLIGAGSIFLDDAYNASKHYGTRLRFNKTDGTDFMSAVSSVYTQPRYTFEKMTLIGPDTASPRTTSSGSAIKISGSAVPQVFIRDVHITRFYGGKGLWLDNVEDYTIQDLMVWGCQYGIYLTTAPNAGVFINCGVQYCSEDGMYIEGGQSISFIGGLFQTNEKTGLHFKGSNDILFTSTHFEGNNTTSTAGEGAVKFTAATNYANQHIKLLNCTFNAAADKIITTGGALGGWNHNNISIDGGRMNAVSLPKITWNAYAVYCSVIGVAALAEISDSGTSNTNIYQGLNSSVATTVPDAAYDSGWNGSLLVPTRNAIWDALGAITAGIYTPTITNIANVGASLGYQCRYIRIGNYVTVTGKVAITATAAAPTVTQFRIDLPIASNIASTDDLSGSGAVGAGSLTNYASAEFYGHIAGDAAQCDYVSKTTDAVFVMFTFSYTVI